MSYGIHRPRRLIGSRRAVCGELRGAAPRARPLSRVQSAERLPLVLRDGSSENGELFQQPAPSGSISFSAPSESKHRVCAPLRTASRTPEDPGRAMPSGIPGLRHAAAALRAVRPPGHEKRSHSNRERHKKNHPQTKMPPNLLATCSEHPRADAGKANNPSPNEPPPNHPMVAGKNGNVSGSRCVVLFSMISHQKHMTRSSGTAMDGLFFNIRFLTGFAAERAGSASSGGSPTSSVSERLYEHPG